MNTFAKQTKPGSLCLVCVSFFLLFSLFAAGCAKGTDGGTLWQNAVYTSDVSVGEGGKTVRVEVRAGDRSVTLTVATDGKTLADALLMTGIIEGEEGPYGLYIKKVNGITADYDADGSYWAFYRDGEYMMTGVDGTDISGGEHFELVYTK